MATNQRIPPHAVATDVRQENGVTIVRYHATDVVSFDENFVMLRTGGWRTVTTRPA